MSFLFNSFQVNIVYSFAGIFPLSQLEYLKTPGYAERGGQFTPPPPLNPMFDIQIWQMKDHYIIEKLMWSTFRIWIKIYKFAKIEFYFAKSSCKVKMFAKNVLKMLKYNLKKALDHAISNRQKV